MNVPLLSHELNFRPICVFDAFLPMFDTWCLLTLSFPIPPRALIHPTMSYPLQPFDKLALTNSWELLQTTIQVIHQKVQRRREGQGFDAETFAELWRTSVHLAELEADLAKLLGTRLHSGLDYAESF